jgi:hypothetical protein
MMAIGSAIFWPLNQTSQINKEAIDKLEVKFEQHEQLPDHPQGQALIQQLQNQVYHLEDQQKSQTDRDRKELTKWREKALGLSPNVQ